MKALASAGEILPEQIAERPSAIVATDKTARATSPSSPEAGSRSHGRPKGAGSMALSDAPLIERMHDLITRGECTSASAAAQVVVKDANGGGTAESKIRRLVGRYKNKFAA